MKPLKTADLCCGCTACVNVCNHNAIIMKPDEMGFMYPFIDEDKCVQCGLCERVCQFKQNYDRFDNYNSPIVYGVRSVQPVDLDLSQTAGAFFVLAKYMISLGGVVYGAGWGVDHQVQHKRATTLSECSEFRGSKYVQSNLDGVFSSVKQDLKEGKSVLFSGTPCQVAGLKSLLSSSLRRNLYTVDLICHSVPSPKIWHDYLKWIEKKYGDKIIKANFRDKKFGWHGAVESYQLKKRKSALYRRSLGMLHFTSLDIRQSCANCPYANMLRVGDITIGDFWGWEEFYQEWNDNKGVNLLFVNSDKGRQYFGSVRNLFNVKLSNADECIQPQLKTHVNLSPYYQQFKYDYINKGIDFVLKKYADESFMYKLKSYIKDFINYEK